jgi:hypothetical protein
MCLGCRGTSNSTDFACLMMMIDFSTQCSVLLPVVSGDTVRKWVVVTPCTPIGFLLCCGAHAVEQACVGLRWVSMVSLFDHRLKWVAKSPIAHIHRAVPTIFRSKLT